MPYIQITLLEGRSFEQKQALVEEITEVVSKHTGAPKEAVHIILTECKRGDSIAQGGQFK